jgi:hypothetical protein
LKAILRFLRSLPNGPSFVPGIEEPGSTRSTYRKPDHTFDPWEYTAGADNDNYKKKTCLDRSIMPERKATCRYDTTNLARHGADYANIRSATPVDLCGSPLANFAREQIQEWRALTSPNPKIKTCLGSFRVCLRNIHMALTLPSNHTTNGTMSDLIPPISLLG